MSILLSVYFLLSLLGHTYCMNIALRGDKRSDSERLDGRQVMSGNLLLSLPQTYTFTGSGSDAINLSSQLISVKGNNPRTIQFSMKTSQNSNNIRMMIGNKYRECLHILYL